MTKKETKINFGQGNTALCRSRQEDHESEVSQDYRVRKCMKQNHFSNNDIITVNPPTFISWPCILNNLIEGNSVKSQFKMAWCFTTTAQLNLSSAK